MSADTDASFNSDVLLGAELSPVSGVLLVSGAPLGTEVFDESGISPVTGVSLETAVSLCAGVLFNSGESAVITDPPPVSAPVSPPVLSLLQPDMIAITPVSK
ncbi:MAG: hypothetical protein KTR32_23765 [Granulosicoccus sp.]|nr:hypothetical protein [Granulosicoccus sp.]